MNLKKCIAQIPYFASIFVLLLFWLPATAGEQEDVQATINGQCQAFLEDDVTRAFTYASPSIRSMFGTPQNFGEMVRRGYPMVWKPAGMTFLEQKETPQGRTQDVQIFDASGTAHYLRYFVTQTLNGWKISGVQLLDIADISV
ncbi:DUF4864 domain-containing protein [Candidatus Njordibacter sp. Uisw_056]|jgi:hypothetical protein|uniref:DUF4864 domain-containing protein n=1 Tax=Candidatus Njordibacter sp. Uisw_056 TaxID=3230973 RepID=UPI003D39F3BC